MQKGGCKGFNICENGNPLTKIACTDKLFLVGTPGSHLWTDAEKQLFKKAFGLHKKDFYLLQKKVRTLLGIGCLTDCLAETGFAFTSFNLF